MHLIDTHSHLEDFIFNGEIEEILTRAREAGLVNIITCSTNPAEWPVYQKLCAETPDISWQIGIHPTEIKLEYADAFEAFGTFFTGKAAPVAIGETGLDFYWLPKDPEEAEAVKARQMENFKRHLMLASQFNTKVCVHARNSIDECVEAISASGVPFSNVVFHCYSGTAEQMKMLNDLGARGSFTGIITYKNAEEMREAMLAQGIEKLMLETDCPYLAPVPFRGKKNEPSLLPYTARSAGEAFGVSPQYIADATTQNAKDFFGLL